jgi:hypothetical protein
MSSRPECNVTVSCISSFADVSSQLQTGKGTGAETYNGMVDCFQKIIKNEGWASTSNAGCWLTKQDSPASIAASRPRY